jgi:hypothetical protein
MQVNSQVKVIAIDHVNAGQAGLVITSEIIEGVEMCHVKVDASEFKECEFIDIPATDLQYLG